MKEPRACVSDLKSAAYLCIVEIGASALTTVNPLPNGSIPLIRARFRFKSPITSPAVSSGTITSTLRIGSNSCGLASRIACLKPMLPAISNATPDESTEWELPSYSSTLMPTTGKPANTPCDAALRTPFSTEGMYSLGTLPPTTELENVIPASAPEGATRINTCPYCPLPPDCFLCL